MVYYFTWEHDVPSLPPRWEQLLSPERVHKAMQYKRESDRRLCAWSFLLLRYALFCEYKTLDMPHWIYDENGKPHDSQKKYCFNISHCDTAVACAVDTREIGVDVQDFRPVSEAVIRKVCSDSEIGLLQRSAQPEKLFAAFWSGKEAFGKQNGNGINYDLQAHTFWLQDEAPLLARADAPAVKTQLTDRFALSVCAFRDADVIAVSLTEMQKFLMNLLC